MTYKLCVFVFSSHFCFSKNAFSCRFFSCYLVQMSFSFCLTLHALSTLVSSSKIMISILTTVSVYVLMRMFKMRKIASLSFQKQPSEAFCQKRCSQKFHQIHRKTHVQKCLVQVLSCEFGKISENTFFTEHLQSIASVFRCVKPILDAVLY